MPPLEAALKDREQIGFTILSLTVSLDRGAHPAALHGRHRRPPVPRVRGDARRHDSRFRPVVSLTLTPMMCAKLLHHRPES